MVATVRTVLGDVPAGDLGVCDAHDHLFLRSPLLPGQELADREEAAQRLRSFRGFGGGTVVQWTPHGLGAGPDRWPGCPVRRACTWWRRPGCTRRRTVRPHGST
ncbi:hypothetical protein [Streptomyces sp. NBC_01383]|uniref:hypothetical protein n=1 Tax=Streptomyces sp. NBC_01383 TaxID=2903846 RepID=UPI00386D3E3F